MKVGDKVIFKHHLCGDFEEGFIIGKTYKITKVCDFMGWEEFYLDNVEINIFLDQIQKIVPNNKLSRLFYKNMVESKCGKYLLEDL